MEDELARQRRRRQESLGLLEVEGRKDLPISRHGRSGPVHDVDGSTILRRGSCGEARAAAYVRRTLRRERAGRGVSLSEGTRVGIYGDIEEKRK